MSQQEDAQNLLNAIFGRIESGGYIAIVEVPALPGVEQKRRWDSMRPRYLAVRPEQVPELGPLDPANAWYFSPVVYSQPDRHKDSVLEACVLWVDSDKEGVDPFTFTPSPSAIVESSPGKHHVYWFLDTPLATANLEFYNRKLVYANDADPSGVDANQLLRLCAGSNIKRNPSTPVRLIYLNLDRVYGVATFAALPEVPHNSLLSIELPPTPTELISSDWLLQKYGEQMSARLLDNLTRRQRDRSRALWHIYNECARANIPAVDCYWLVRGTPNDKFYDFTYGGDESLWRDVQGGYQLAAAGVSNRGIIDQMQTIRLKKGPQAIMLAELGKVLINDMLRRGMCYQTKDGASKFYLDLTQGSGHLMVVGLRSAALRRHMLDRYGINPGTQEWMQLYEYIAARCLDNEPVRVHRLSHYDPETGVLWINRNDNTVYRVTANAITVVPNGADGILFLNTPGSEPFTATMKMPNQRAEDDETLWEKFVLSCANLPDDYRITHREVRHIIYSWILALFFKDLFLVKPILLIHGDTGSGKTMLFKAMLRILFGPDVRPDAPYADENAFDNAVTNADLVTIDNADDWQKWLANKLALLATGYTVRKRKLYTDNESFSQVAAAFAGITSRDPKFINNRDDVAERLLPILVVPYRSRLVNEGAIASQISSLRGALWGELLTDLMRLLAILQETPGNPGYLPRLQMDFRQADFGAWLQLTCKLKNLDPQRLYTHIVRLQGLEAVQDDPLVFVLKFWLTRKRGEGTNEGRQITIAALHAELCAMPGGEEFQKRVGAPRGLATKLGLQGRHLKTVGIIVHKHGDSSPLYSFTQEAC